MRWIVYVKSHRLYYSVSTLFTDGAKGISVIQQRWNPETKCTWWGPINPRIADDILDSPRLASYFAEHATEPDADGLYFTITLRKLMWALGMRAMRKEFWETHF